jgi:hypothetical protein
MLRWLGASALLVLLTPLSARADVEWTTWSGYPATTRTGTFERGFTVSMTPASFPGDAFRAEGTYFEADSPVMGTLDGVNPPYQMILSGPATGTIINPGDLVVDIDLSDLPRTARPVFGIVDQKFAYELQLLDDEGELLPLTGITFTPYNITYFPPQGSTDPGLIADQNTIFDGNEPTTLRRDFLNDAVPTQYYQHTGLTILSDLPAGTRTIRLLGGTISEAEGVGFAIGAEFEPSGDTNGNGSVTASDALLALQIVVGLHTLTPEILIRIDMNRDGELTIGDAFTILKLAVGGGI